MTSCYVPRRYIMILFSHFGFFIVYALRVNLSVVLVAMVNSTYANVDNSDPECRSTDTNVTAAEYNGGEFNWNQNQQGIILSSFFYGYLLTQVPGGWLSMKFGGKIVLGLGVLGTCVLTILTPLAARTSIYWLIVVRVLEGFGEGVTFPAMHSLLAQWAPPEEISRMAVIAYSGMQTGTIVSLPLSGVLADSSFLGGWPSAFYVLGAVGCVWFLFWMIFIYDGPENHPSISNVERLYITKSHNNSSSDTKSTKIPWSHILTSRPVWAIMIGLFSHCWVWYMLLTGLPSYFSEVLDFKLKNNGFLSALPYLSSFVVQQIGGWFADYLRKNWISTTAARRLAGILAFYPSAGFLLLVSYAGCDQIALSVGYLVLAVTFITLNQIGLICSQVDIAPRYVGIIMGLANSAGTIAGCITPSVTGYFTNEHPTREQYRKVFMIAASICVIGGTFCNVFVSGELQPWNDIYHDEENFNGSDEEQVLINSSNSINDDELVDNYVRT
eukprot:TCONS_00060179-protein